MSCNSRWKSFNVSYILSDKRITRTVSHDWCSGQWVLLWHLRSRKNVTPVDSDSIFLPSLLSFPTKSWLSNLGFSHTKYATPTAVPYNLMYLCQHVRSCCQVIYIQFITHLSCLHRVLSRDIQPMNKTPGIELTSFWTSKHYMKLYSIT